VSPGRFGDFSFNIILLPLDKPGDIPGEFGGKTSSFLDSYGTFSEHGTARAM
jgi:hypothetical protein